MGWQSGSKDPFRKAELSEYQGQPGKHVSSLGWVKRLPIPGSPPLSGGSEAAALVLGPASSLLASGPLLPATPRRPCHPGGPDLRLLCPRRSPALRAPRCVPDPVPGFRGARLASGPPLPDGCCRRGRPCPPSPLSTACRKPGCSQNGRGRGATRTHGSRAGTAARDWAWEGKKGPRGAGAVGTPHPTRARDLPGDKKGKGPFKRREQPPPPSQESDRG